MTTRTCITPSRTFPQIKGELYYKEVEALRDDNVELYKEYDRLIAIKNIDLQIALRIGRLRAGHTIYRQGETVVYFDGVAGHMASKVFRKESHADLCRENMQLQLVIDSGNRALSNQISKG